MNETRKCLRRSFRSSMGIFINSCTIKSLQPTTQDQPSPRINPTLRLVAGIALCVLSLIMTGSFLKPEQCPSPQQGRKNVQLSATTHQVTLPQGGSAWQVNQWVFSQDYEMNSTMSQEWMTFLQSNDLFLALRYPTIISSTLSSSGAYSSPVIFDAPYTPTLVLQDTRSWPFKTVFTVPLELRPERQAFLDSELPSAPGEQWIALGLQTTPLADSSAVPALAGGDWHFLITFYLDLSDRPNAGMGETLPMYYCFEGQSPPFFFQTQLTSNQGQGITYLGPQNLRMASWFDPPDFELHGTNVVHITPTQPITLGHFMVNTRPDPLTITFDYSSTLPVAWDIVTGTITGPHLPLMPITTSITLPPPTGPLERYYFWMLSHVPENTPDGVHTLLITATDVTSPDLYIQTSDFLWVGEWVAPPVGDGYRLYLPLVVREAL